MIEFNNLSHETPYLVFKEKYDLALKLEQKNIEAICIASYSKSHKEVRSRFVNLKFVNNKEFIFFSNYKSPKSEDFKSHRQITGLIFWHSINAQIRMKANIKKTNKEFSELYFSKRNKKKNALAISSNQSMPIRSYEDVEANYINTFENDDLSKCPNHWGGFSFEPYYFEFWQGHKSRLNKRDIYELKGDKWSHYYLQP